MMPGHFTHIYAARRVADFLAEGNVPDWLASTGITQDEAREIGGYMRTWEKFTATGAIGPDLFYFSQDYSAKAFGAGPVPPSDHIMLALAVYYFYDYAKENDWGPLLVILDEVNSTLAAFIRFLIKLQQIWQDFVSVWDAAIGPITEAIGGALDAVTGGVLSALSDGLSQLKTMLETVGEQELLTFADIFGAFNTCVNKGWDEQSFLWSDMSHYRGTTRLGGALIEQARSLRGASKENEEQYQQFMAFALGWITHIATDTVAHSFVNEQCGGPYRLHPQRHHLIENHIDAWNYRKAGDGTIPTDPWGATDTYPDLSESALWFFVQFTPDEPHGKQRPATLPDDPAARKAALDVDGEMPMWMAEAFVQALKTAFLKHPHPLVYQGDDFQKEIDQGLLTQVVELVTGHGLEQPWQDLLKAVAPPSDIGVPPGFPLPWQIGVMYRVMITFYKLQFKGDWELSRPQAPPIIITPPSSDFDNLATAPDFSGPSSGDPVEDFCNDIKSFFDWLGKELDGAVKLIEDIIKMLASPGSYGIRLLLYELAMAIWSITTTAHEILAHTGFAVPHGEQLYPSKEQRMPNEIDLPLITLGSTPDAEFLQALADAWDPLGNLDKNQAIVATGHSVQDPHYPYYPTLRWCNDDQGRPAPPQAFEFHRPWAYPQWRVQADKCSDPAAGTNVQNYTEKYDPSQPGVQLPRGLDAGVIYPGPYAAGTTPDQVFFRTDAPIDPEVRAEYERARTPADTDMANQRHIAGSTAGISPLGDPVPFSAYLIAQLLRDASYPPQFNLDSDRAYGYLTWDWVRGVATGTADLPFDYHLPNVPPQQAPGNVWEPAAELQLQYVDPPVPPPAPPPRHTQTAAGPVVDPPESGGGEH